MGIFDKFKSGFKKSASAFTSGLRDIVVKKEIDDKTLDKIEEYLIQSDVGVVAASEIKEIISDSKIDPNKDIAEEINMDISTISRVANSKYVDTPYGIKLIKSFFSEGIKNSKGEEISTIEVKKSLEGIIINENKKF